MIHHRSIVFPAIVITLSLALAAVVFFSSGPSEPSSAPAAPDRGGEEAVSVDEEEYRAQVRESLEAYARADAEAGSDVQRLVAAEDAQKRLFSLTVPGQYRDLHLDLVLGLNLVIQGLRGEEGVLEKGRDKLDAAAVEYPWID